MSRARPIEVIISAQKKFDRDLSDTRLLGGGSGYIAVTCSYDGVPYRGVLFRCDGLQTFSNKDANALGIDPRSVLSVSDVLDETKDIAIPRLPTMGSHMAVSTDDIVLSDSGSCTGSPNLLRGAHGPVAGQSANPESSEPMISPTGNESQVSETPAANPQPQEAPQNSVQMAAVSSAGEINPDILGSEDDEDMFSDEVAMNENVSNGHTDMFDLTVSSPQVAGRPALAGNNQNDIKSAQQMEAGPDVVAPTPQRGRTHKRHRSLQALPSTSNGGNLTSTIPLPNISAVTKAPRRKSQTRKRADAGTPVQANPEVESPTPPTRKEISARTAPAHQKKRSLPKEATRINPQMESSLPHGKGRAKSAAPAVEGPAKVINTSEAEPPVKRARGRPRMQPVETHVNEAAVAKTQAPTVRRKNVTQPSVPIDSTAPEVMVPPSSATSVSRVASPRGRVAQQRNEPEGMSEDEQGPPPQMENDAFDYAEIPDPPNLTKNCYVWAKDTWSPYWPGQYIRMVSPSAALIAWCGDKSHSNISLEHVEPFVENIGKRLIGKRKEKKYSRGFIDAVRACNVSLADIPEIRRLNGPVRKALIDAQFDIPEKAEIIPKRRSSKKFF